MVGLTREGPSLIAGGICNFMKAESNIYAEAF
jgi:hypothetical protein